MFICCVLQRGDLLCCSRCLCDHRCPVLIAVEGDAPRDRPLTSPSGSSPEPPEPHHLHPPGYASLCAGISPALCCRLPHWLALDALAFVRSQAGFECPALGVSFSTMPWSLPGVPLVLSQMPGGSGPPADVAAVPGSDHRVDCSADIHPPAGPGSTWRIRLPIFPGHPFRSRTTTPL